MGSSSRLDEISTMEDAVKDVILLEQEAEPVLERLIFLTLREVASGDKLFPTPLEEPFFYQRFFRPWVKDAIEEHGELKKSEESHVQSLLEEQSGS